MPKITYVDHAGTAGGRRIETPKGVSTRPTSDRVREALFGALQARGVLDGAVVLDLFAGQCRSILPRLTDPALPRDRRADLAHTLKGSAAGVGAAQVRALADVAETHLRSGAGPVALDALADAVTAALSEIAAART